MKLYLSEGRRTGSAILKKSAAGQKAPPLCEMVRTPAVGTYTPSARFSIVESTHTAVERRRSVGRRLRFDPYVKYLASDKVRLVRREHTAQRRTGS